MRAFTKPIPGTQIPIIQNGNVVSGLPFPVAIDQGSGSMGANVPLSQEGVAFNFQGTVQNYKQKPEKIPR